MKIRSFLSRIWQAPFKGMAGFLLRPAGFLVQPISFLVRPVNLLVLAGSFLVLLAGICFIKPLRNLVNRLTATENNIRYIPHQAPDSSLLGKYEQVNGPFRLSVMNNQDVIIEHHQWNIDLANKEYRASGNGYMRVNNSRGEEEYVAVELSETLAYDTLRTNLPPIHPLVAVPAKPNLTEPVTSIPDTLSLAPDASQSGILNRGLWEAFRTIRLPITLILDNQEFVIRNCRVSISSQQWPATRVTTVTGTLRSLTGGLPAEPLILSLEEPVNNGRPIKVTPPYKQ